MKKILISIAVLVLAGLLGSVWNQAFPFAKGWVGSRPEAAEVWYNERAFQSRANKVMNCIDDRLTWSRAIGIIRSEDGTTLVVLVHLLPENLRDTSDWESVSRQFQIVIACSHYVPGWEKLSVVGHTIYREVGFDGIGKTSMIYKPMVTVVVSFEKEDALLFLQAEKPGDFFESRIDNRTIGVTEFGLWSPVPQTLTSMQGNRVIGAMEQLTEWNNARIAEIEIMKQEAMEAKETQVPFVPTEPSTLK